MTKGDRSMEIERMSLDCAQPTQNCCTTLHYKHIEDESKRDSLKVSKVHVNPNFTNGKNLVIHVNPRIHQNRKIHVNPKMMEKMLPQAEELKNLNVSNGVPCNERLISSSEEIQKSIHVNPKMMDKFSSKVHKSVQPPPMTSKPALTDNRILEKKVNHKLTSPRLLSISRRKLVRVGSTVKKQTVIPSPSSLKRVNKNTVKTVFNPSINKLTNVPVAMKFISIKNKYRINAYKIDRTGNNEVKPKKRRNPVTSVRNVNSGLVAIGGIMYKSSKTQLVRSGTNSSTQKKKNYVAGTNGDTFVMAKNGKKLHRLSVGKSTPSVTRYVISRNNLDRQTVLKKVPNSIVQTNPKNVISYKAKQRSLQILRDKLRKNYIPCLLYRRFGHCEKYLKGTCPKLHDKKQVALCKNFLQGKCLMDDCPLSHDIGPEKMPTCKYFLEGCCIRDSCPYLHVKVSSKTPICPHFLRGYCADGNKCKQRHTYICPDYEKSGACPKGKYCPYPHKLKKSSTPAKSRGSRSVQKSLVSKSYSHKNKKTVNVEMSDDSRKRYYDESMSDERLAEMRDILLKRMKCMKAGLGLIENEDIENSTQSTLDAPPENSDRLERPKRAPIGPLPAYIPIN